MCFFPSQFTLSYPEGSVSLHVVGLFFTTPSHFINVVVSVLWWAGASKTTGDVDFLDASCHLPGAPMLHAATQNSKQTFGHCSSCDCCDLFSPFSAQA